MTGRTSAIVMLVQGFEHLCFALCVNLMPPGVSLVKEETIKPITTKTKNAKGG
jgi:hypothetical protein